jgi:hypothetical protein
MIRLVELSDYVSFLLTFNDQSIRVVECPEFRELMVYACPNINDSDLAKRDKIRNAIVNASVDYFEVLKKQLKVCFGFEKLIVIHRFYLVFLG